MLIYSLQHPTMVYPPGKLLYLRTSACPESSINFLNIQKLPKKPSRWQFLRIVMGVRRVYDDAKVCTHSRQEMPSVRLQKTRFPLSWILLRTEIHPNSSPISSQEKPLYFLNLTWQEAAWSTVQRLYSGYAGITLISENQGLQVVRSPKQNIIVSSKDDPGNQTNDIAA